MKTIKDVIYGGGCYSMLGRVGGRQELSIGQWCDYEHTVRNLVANP